VTNESAIIQVGLIGSAIQKSRSPFLHETEGRALGLRVSYRLIDLNSRGVGVEALPDLLCEAEQSGFAGVNITHPCKQAVIPFLDGLSDDAAAIGAVNTVVFKDSKRHGYNTDEWGFRENFRRGMQGASLASVVQLGAGGAGAATANAMLTLGAERLSLFDADPDRCGALVQSLQGRFGKARAAVVTDLKAAVTEASGLVNATPMGMAEHPGLPLPAQYLRPDLWVAEIVYFPLETPLLAESRRLGARTVDGGGMAVFQAAMAFELFTGVAPDPERMLRSFFPD
jgi:shikimate dehydrogenase